MRLRQGFTLLELFVVLVMVGIISAIVIPSVGSGMSATNVQRAASVVQADFQLARSMAARRRAPVQISVDATNRVLRVRNLAADTTYSARYFMATSTASGPHNTIERGAEYPVSSMTTTANTITIFPNGLSSAAITVTLTAGTKSRMIEMTRAGQIRVKTP